MSHPLIPQHLMLTSSPVLMNPAVIPELHQRIKDWTPAASVGFMNRARRMGKKNKKSKNKSQVVMASSAQDGVQTISVALTPAPNSVLEAGQTENSEQVAETGKTLTFAKMFIKGALLSEACYVQGDNGEKILMIDGYDRIGAQLAEFTNNAEIDGTLVYVNSPGGVTAACFEMCEKIRAMNSEKPIIFYSDEMICSAAYAIASSGTEIIGSKTAQIGSIGVAWPRLDVSEKNKKDGIITEITTSGKTKSYGYPETALDDDERANRQEKVDYLASLFFDDVSTSRGLTPAAVQDLEADVFFTPFAIEKGLADYLGDEATAITRLTALVTGEKNPIPKSKSDPTPNPKPSKLKAATPKSKQETNMSASLKSRLLVATVSMFAMRMAANMDDEKTAELDEKDIEAAVDDEAGTAVENMDDDKVAELNEEDVTALDEDEDLKAEDEDKLPPESEAGKDDVKTASARIAYKAIARVRSDAASAAAVPATGEAPDPMAVAKAVMAMPLAKTHPALANQTAFEAGMTVETAKARFEAAESDRKASAKQTTSFKGPDHPVAPNSALAPKQGVESAMVAAARRRNPAFKK